MTDNKTKFRGLVLAALMVLSVIGGSFAFAGTAAAAASSVSVTSAGDVTAGQSSANQTVSVQLTLANNTSDTLVLNTSDVASVNAVSVSDATAVDESVSVTTDGNISIDVSDANDDGTDDTVTLDVEIEYDTTSEEPLIGENIGVFQSGTEVGAASFDIVPQTDDVLGDDDFVYAGQIVYYEVNDVSADYKLFKGTTDDASPVTPVEDDTGYIKLDTSALGTGQYFIGNNSSSAEVSFNIVEQDLSAEFGAATVGNAGDTTVTLDVSSSNRPGTFLVTVTSDQYTEDELIDLFGDADTEMDGVQISVDGNEDDGITLNFAEHDAGAKDLSFDVTDASTSASASVEVKNVNDGSASLSTNTLQTERGDVVGIVVTFDGAADSGTLVIGNEDRSGYQANVSVSDGDDDDNKVVVLFNTYTAGQQLDSTVWAEAQADGDSATFNQSATDSESELSTILDTGDYELAVKANEDEAAKVLSSPDDVGSLYIGERSTNSVTLWTAPAGNQNDVFDVNDESGIDAADITQLVEDSTLTQDSSIAQDDFLVVQTSVGGLEGVFQNNSNSLADAIASGSVEVTVEQTNPGKNRDPKVVDVAASGDAVTFVPDADNDAYYLVIDTSSDNLDVTQGDDPAELAAGDKFNVTFSVTDERLLAGGENESVSTEFEVVEGDVSLESEEVTVEAAAEQNISGTSTLAPGTTFKVDVSSTGDTQPRFFKTAQVEVQADGTWSVAFNFSEQSENDTFAVNIPGGADVDAEGTVEAAAPDNKGDEECPTPTATAADGDGDGCPGTVTEEPVTTTEQPPETTTEQPPKTTTEQPPETTTEQPETTTAGDGGNSSNSPVPGFGVTVAIVALVAAALLALRRD